MTCLNPLKENFQANREIYQKYFSGEHICPLTPVQQQLLGSLDAYSSIYKKEGLSGYLGNSSNISFINADDFSLKYGNVWKPPETAKHFKQMHMKACYQNSLDVSRKSGSNLIYVEGIVISKSLPIPISHAWVVDKTGQVIETTIRPETDSNESVYLGVPFDCEQVYKVFKMEKQYGVVCKSALKQNVLDHNFSLSSYLDSNFSHLSLENKLKEDVKLNCRRLKHSGFVVLG